MAPALIRIYIPAVASPLYNRDILRLAASIPHLGRLAHPQGRAERTSPVCGSRVSLDVILDEAGRVSEIGLEVRACALGQAAASLMGAHAIGRDAAELLAARAALADYLAERRADPGDWPGLDVLAPARGYPARHASILLVFDAAAAAARQAAERPAVAS